MTAIHSNSTISWIAEVLSLNITPPSFEVCMPSEIQSSANHKLVEVLSNGKINCSSPPLDEIELIKHGFDINSVEKFSCELRWDMQSFTKAVGINTRAFTRTFERHKKSISV
jgi:hypothetical protein